MKPTQLGRGVFILPAVFAALMGGAAHTALGACGLFTDVAADSFCQFVLEIFSLGITTGTTPTTYDPTANVNRLQMAAFLSRSVDGVLKRGSRRAAMDQFWTTQNSTVLGLTDLESATPQLLRSDGLDIWVAGGNDGSVRRVRANDGKLLETWIQATSSYGVLVAMGRILVTGVTNPGRLYQINPSQAAGVVTTVASNLPIFPQGLAFDGARVWTANHIGPASVSIVTPGASIPWTVTTVTTGFSQPFGALYDGTNVWVTDQNPAQTAGTLLKLDSAGAILQTVTVGITPQQPLFDGTNIWVPNFGFNGFNPSVSVVRASSGAVLQTLTGNGLNGPRVAAFDGQRVLITNSLGASVSLWKAADLTTLGSFGTGGTSSPSGACSDGINFWIALAGATSKLARF